jgi:SPP1 gp7 family putative phage head morphogenesis protein
VGGQGNHGLTPGAAMIPRHAFRLDLAATAKRQRKFRRSTITIKPIVPTNALAQGLAAVTTRIPTFWAAAIDRILAQYDPPAPGTRDSLFGLGDILEALRQEGDRLVISITPQLREWALRLERWHRARWAANVLTATGVQLDTILGAGDVAEPVEAFLQRNVALVRSVSDEARSRISDIVFRNYQKRTPIAEVARDMREAVDMGRRRAIRIAADQTTKLSAALDTERMVQAGIEKWQWVHSGKLHAREEHLERDGKVYSFDDPPEDMPGELPFCGCRKLGVLDLD